MKILCTQTNRDRLCDGCGDTANDNRCKTCLDESRGVPGPLGDDLLGVYSGDIGLAKMKEKYSTTFFEAWRKLCEKGRSNCQGKSLVGSLLKGDPIIEAKADNRSTAAYGYQMFARFEHPLPRDFRCAPLPYIEPLYTKELPTKPGVYKVRYKIISDLYKTMEVEVTGLISNLLRVEFHPDGLSSVTNMPLDIFCESAWNVEWLFVRDLGTLETD